MAMQQPVQYYGQPQQGAVVMQQMAQPNPNLAQAQQIMLSGLFGCCDDCEVCLCAHFCPCIAWGQWHERVGMGSCAGACCSFCIMCYFCPWCIGCYAGSVRSALYVRLGLPDPGCCTNCLCHSCCSCCAIAQEGRAAKALWMGAGGDKPAGMVAAR